MLSCSPIQTNESQMLAAQTLPPALRNAFARHPPLDTPLRPTVSRLAPPTGFCESQLWQWLTQPHRQMSGEPLEDATLKVARQALAAPTWEARHGLFRRFLAAEPSLQHQDVGTQLAMFVQSQQVMLSSRLTYAKTLSAIATALGWEVPMLRLYMAGLRKLGAEAPTHQATPLPRDLMRRIISATRDPHTQAALFLAWKTASRWADILTLTRESFVQLTPTQIVIEWSRTKTTSQGDFNPWRWTVVHDEGSMAELVRTLRSLRRNQPLTTIPTAQVPQLLQRFGGDYTAHSVKRGAVDHLVHEAVAGRLDQQLIPLLAKHQNVASQFPATTLRYVGDKVSLALMLGSQKATILL
jgi:hypothetical protein